MAFIVLLCIAKKLAYNLSAVKFQYCIKYTAYALCGSMHINTLPAWKTHHMKSQH